MDAVFMDAMVMMEAFSLTSEGRRRIRDATVFFFVISETFFESAGQAKECMSFVCKTKTKKEITDVQ